MSIHTSTPLPQEEADHRAMLEHVFKGKPVDSEVSKRVRERADRNREDLRARGVAIDSVELIRQSREEI